MTRRLPIIILLAVFALSTVAWAVDGQGLTWDELKAVQTTERAELLKAQSEQLKELVGRQKDEIEVTSRGGYASNTLSLAKTHSDERLELAKISSEERATLAKTHADERKAFLTAQQQAKRSQ